MKINVRLSQKVGEFSKMLILELSMGFVRTIYLLALNGFHFTLGIWKEYILKLYVCGPFRIFLTVGMWAILGHCCIFSNIGALAIKKVYYCWSFNLISYVFEFKLLST